MWKDLKRILKRLSKETDDGSCFIHHLASSLYFLIIFVAGWLIGNHFEPYKITNQNMISKNVDTAAVFVVITHVIVVIIIVINYLAQQLTRKIRTLSENKHNKKNN